MPLPTPGEIKVVAKVGEGALREVAPGIAAKLTEELISIYGKGEDVIAQASKGHEKLVAGIENVIGEMTGSIHPSAYVDKHAFVHPNAIVKEGAQIMHGANIGDGVVVGEKATIFEAKIGDNAVIGNKSVIGRKAEIARGTVIGDETGIHNSVKLGDNVVVGNKVRVEKESIIGANSRIGDGAVIWHGATADQGLTMGAGARLGARAHLGENVQLGERALVGSMSTLGKGVVVGEDAQLMRVVVGEGSTIGPKATVGKAASFNGQINNDWHGATIGADTKIGSGTTIGAKSVIGNSALVDDGAFFNYEVVVEDGAKIGKNVVVDRAAKIESGAVIQEGSYVGLRRVVQAGSPWTPASEDALKSAEFAAQAAERTENAGLKAAVSREDRLNHLKAPTLPEHDPLAGAEPAKKLEVAAVSREDALKAFEGTDAARARFEKALTRIDEASVRKVEAAQRAESVTADPLAVSSDGNLRVRSVKPEGDHIESIEEFSNGRKVIIEKTEYPVISKKITEEPDGTRITGWRRSTSGDSSLSYVEAEAETIEHANGNRERRFVKTDKDGYETYSGSIQHADGSLERWTEADFSKVTRFENKNGVVTSHRDSEEYDYIKARLKARFG